MLAWALNWWKPPSPSLRVVVVMTSWHWPSASCCRLRRAYRVIIVITFSVLERGRRLLHAHGDGVVVVVTFSMLGRGRRPRHAHGDDVGVVVTFAIHTEMVSSSSSSMTCWHGVISSSCARRRRQCHRLHHGIGHGHGIDVVTSTMVAWN